MFKGGIKPVNSPFATVGLPLHTMAAYFQSYFQASSMPKRLLQYALSRLEVLDTDAIGLESLDIAWGKNSTFEFKDVGLRLRVSMSKVLWLQESILKSNVDIIYTARNSKAFFNYQPLSKLPKPASYYYDSPFQSIYTAVLYWLKWMVLRGSYE